MIFKIFLFVINLLFKELILGLLNGVFNIILLLFLLLVLFVEGELMFVKDKFCICDLVFLGFLREVFWFLL